MAQQEDRRPEFTRRPEGRLFGVYPAVVVDLRDPEQQGRVKVRLSQVEAQGKTLELWARLATLMAGDNAGTWFVPDAGNEVLVAFEGGDPRRPFVIGSLWNAQQAPPERMDEAGNNPVKAIRSRSGLRLALDDTQGQETVTVETPGGQRITLKDGPGAVEIADSSGNSIRIEPGGVTVAAAGKVTINASVVEVSAGLLRVNAGTAIFSGVLQADSVVTNSVVSASYSPGAGNLV